MKLLLLLKRKENAPPNSADICFNCEFEPNCCYSAKKIYLNPSQKTTNWPSSIVLGAEIYNIEDESTSRDIEDILRDKNAEPQRRSLLEKCLAHPKTNYGRCVYSMDNDVCDNQVVSMFFDDGSTATVTMIGECKDKSLRKTTGIDCFCFYLNLRKLKIRKINLILKFMALEVN